MNDTGGKTWLWAGIAFVVGLAIGLGVFVWQFSTTERTIATAKRSLESQNASLTAEVQRLTNAARTAEASVAAITTPGTGASATTSSAGGQQTAAQPTGPVKITARSVTPAQVARGKQITLTLKVQGSGVTAARMRIYSPAASYDKIFDLAKVAGDPTTWTRTISAPSTPGTFKYFALAYVGGTRYTMPGVSGFTFKVQ